MTHSRIVDTIDCPKCNKELDVYANEKANGSMECWYCDHEITISKHTEEEVSKMWEEACLPGVKEMFEKDGRPDFDARRTSFNDYTDMLAKDGELTPEEYHKYCYVGSVRMSKED